MRVLQVGDDGVPKHLDTGGDIRNLLDSEMADKQANI